MEQLNQDSWKATEQNRQRVRSGPRSRLVEAIAVLLLARPMRVAEIAQILGKPPRYISSYLSYWRVRGLFDYENGYWVLTPQGEEYARTIVEKEMNTRVAQYAALARQILESEEAKPVKQTMNNKAEYYAAQLSGEIQRFIASKTIQTSNEIQKARTTTACIRAVLADLEEDLDTDEKQILEYLLSHYAKWETTYTYIDQLAKDLDADTYWLLQVARRLQSKGLIYIYNDKRLGMRIGLSKRVKEFLRVCTS